MVVFYGGEPLLAIPFIQRVMDGLPGATFVLQSNCTLLHLLPAPYLRRFAALLVSIDGRPETVEAYRGPGVYQRIVQNLEDARRRGYAGHLVARMACSMRTSVYDDVMHLLRHPLRFDSVYWQLDAEWDYPMNVRWGDFAGYLAGSYAPGVARLFDEFARACRGCAGDPARFLQINPFCQPLESMLEGRPCGLRCSAGSAAVSVTTDGRYLACPVASGERWNNIGHLDRDRPADCMGRVAIGPPCTECADYRWCGGRCLYANQTKHWGEEGYAVVCGTVRQILRLCEGFLDELRQLIASGDVKMEWFKFPNERYSLETIP